jgi:exodeoxyribonuclease-3
VPTLLSWNVAGRVKRLDEQAEHVTSLGVDVVCLQEISRATVDVWCDRLQQHMHVAQRAHTDGTSRRPLSVLIAARTPVIVKAIHGLPWPERVAAANIGGIEYVNVHSPISTSANLAKVRTHETLHEHFAGGNGPRVLCGDLNTPRREHPDGRVWTFARTQHGALRPERGERWDRAELALIKGLEPYGFRDAFREHHGLAVGEISWQWARWPGGYRLDHLIVSGEVAVTDVEYLHEWRTAGLSDHSPLLARLEVK